MRLQAKLRRQFLDDDRRLDVNDFLFRFRLGRRRFGSRLNCCDGRFRFGCGRRDWCRQRTRRFETRNRWKNGGAFYRTIGLDAFWLRFFLVNERNGFDVSRAGRFWFRRLDGLRRWRCLRFCLWRLRFRFRFGRRVRDRGFGNYFGRRVRFCGLCLFGRFFFLRLSVSRTARRRRSRLDRFASGRGLALG